MPPLVECWIISMQVICISRISGPLGVSPPLCSLLSVGCICTLSSLNSLSGMNAYSYWVLSSPFWNEHLLYFFSINLCITNMHTCLFQILTSFNAFTLIFSNIILNSNHIPSIQSFLLTSTSLCVVFVASLQVLLLTPPFIQIYLTI